MNIFRFIADMLHLAAICLLLYRIKNTRNCVGKSKFEVESDLENTIETLIFDSNSRYFVQDLRDLPNRVLCALSGPIHVLRQLIQHFHENFLHRRNCIHNLLNAYSETFLHNIRLTWGFVPTFKSTFACSSSFSSNCARR